MIALWISCVVYGSSFLYELLFKTFQPNKPFICEYLVSFMSWYFVILLATGGSGSTSVSTLICQSWVRFQIKAEMNNWPEFPGWSSLKGPRNCPWTWKQSTWYGHITMSRKIWVLGTYTKCTKRCTRGFFYLFIFFMQKLQNSISLVNENSKWSIVLVPQRLPMELREQASKQENHSIMVY